MSAFSIDIKDIKVYLLGMGQNIMTLAETAKYLKVSEKTIHRLMAEDDIPCVKVGAQWRFFQSSIDQWLEERMHKQTGEKKFVPGKTDLPGKKRK